MVNRRAAEENELSCDPEFFLAFQAKRPALRFVEFRQRRGHIRNETTAFHYDVILRVGAEPERSALPESGIPYSLETLEQTLKSQESAVRFHGIQDQRNADAVALLTALETAGPELPIRDVAPTPAQQAWDPESLFALAQKYARRLYLRAMLGREDGALEGVFLMKSDTGLPDWKDSLPTGSGHRWINNPAGGGAVHLDDSLLRDLREHLGASLPEYMIPSAWVAVEQFPTTSSGKIDLKALHAPVQATSRQRPAGRAPRDADEQSLLRIWQEVLGEESLDIDTDIFEAGADSILIFNISALARKSGISLRPADLFRNRSIARWSEARERTSGDSLESLPAAVPAHEPFEFHAVREGEDRPPLIFFHGDWVGGGGYLLRLIPYLPKDQPVYTITPYQFGADRLPNLMEAAEACANAVAARFEKGTQLVLGGFCVGGVYALETARLLHAKGFQLPLLILLDYSGFSSSVTRKTWRTWEQASPARDLVSRGDRFDRLLSLERWVHRPVKEKLSKLKEKLLPNGKTSHFNPAVEELNAASLDTPEYTAYVLAHRLHEPRFFEGHVVMLDTGETLAERYDSDALWFAVEKTQRIIMDGSHLGSITENIAATGASFTRSLNEFSTNRFGVQPVMEST